MYGAVRSVQLLKSSGEIILTGVDRVEEVGVVEVEVVLQVVGCGCRWRKKEGAWHREILYTPRAAGGRSGNGQ